VPGESIAAAVGRHYPIAVPAPWSNCWRDRRGFDWRGDLVAAHRLERQVLQVGNGGWSGAVVAPALAYAVQRGYATAGTDDGHSGSMSGGAQWAVGRPEKLIDFSYRAVHETALLARQVVNAFYANDARRSYFVGCSTGGRQALMAAQRFPEVFDGIIAGAPASNMTGLQAAGVWNEQALLKSPQSAIPPAKLCHPARRAQGLRSYGRAVGRADREPARLSIRSGTLKCQGPDGPQCPHRAAAGGIAPRLCGSGQSAHRRVDLSGLSPGTKAVAGSWKDWLVATPPESARQFAFGNAFFGQLVREGTGWSFRDSTSYRYRRRLPQGRRTDGRSQSRPALVPRAWRQTDPVPRLGDAAIAPGSSVDYYEQVRGFFATYPDARAGEARAVEDFYRLFMVPGMAHCGGGVGPSDFGNGAPVAGGAEHDIVVALDRWVERGVAPEYLIGQGVTVGSPGKPLSRPICPYPRVARYLGRGEPTDATSFSCVTPVPQ
jgi:feruloyl esterase